MKFFKWDTNFLPRFPNIIEKFLGKSSHGEDVSTLPSVNISDENKAFDVNVALPGLDKKDVKVEVQNGCLIVSSEKQYENEDKGKNWMRREYGYSAFKRVFELPESADPEKVLAEMKNGILSIKIAKKPGYESKFKNIEVQ